MTTRGTSTRRFGAGNRENHDASAFYDRQLVAAEFSTESDCATAPEVDRIWCHSAEEMTELPDNSVALMVTSPPYHAGKAYDSDDTYEEYLGLLERIFQETHRVLEPGGRAVVNVANLGRKPYIPLATHVTSLMTDRLGFFMRGEVIWRKAGGASGSCAWGSWQSASNPTLRDVHEYCLCFSKGRMDRARKGVSTIERDDFLAATLSIWDIPPESARRVGHPAPFPVALPRRFIELYSYEGDVVLDPFMGSGSTAIAAVEAGRHYVGYDTDPAYVELAEGRVDAAKSALET
ncbi:MAG: DNA-methyltransferase [Acidimicrobiales bacterium]